MLDSTSIRAHQHTTGQKSSTDLEALGRSRGCFSTKLHVVVNVLGNPTRFVLAPGQRADVTQTAMLLAANQPEALGAEVFIPPKRNCIEQWACDRDLYTDRNKMERFIGRVKHYRRATRYSKTARNYMAFLYAASIMTLLL
jgi:transposase